MVTPFVVKPFVAGGGEVVTMSSKSVQSRMSDILGLERMILSQEQKRRRNPMSAQNTDIYTTLERKSSGVVGSNHSLARSAFFPAVRQLPSVGRVQAWATPPRMAESVRDA